nr:hypothetical protein CFP56_32722 [Quercus suber]
MNFLSLWSWDVGMDTKAYLIELTGNIARRIKSCNHAAGISSLYRNFAASNPFYMVQNLFQKDLIRVFTGMGTLLVIGFYTSICKCLRIIDNTADKSLVVLVFLNLLGTKIMQKLRKRMN